MQQVAAPECEATGPHLLILRVRETSEMEIDLVILKVAFGQEKMEIAIFKTVFLIPDSQEVAGAHFGNAVTFFVGRV